MWPLTTIDWTSALEPGVSPEWASVVIAIAAVIMGISKSGFPTGGALLSVPLILLVMPTSIAAGTTLVIFLCADWMAVWVHRKNIRTDISKPVILTSLIGMLIGTCIWWLVLRWGETSGTAAQVLKQAVGGLSLFFSMYIVMQQHFRETVQRMRLDQLPSLAWGIAIGICTSLANVAGPVMGLFLFTRHVTERREFTATMAWSFWIINWLKVPFLAGVGVITWQTVRIGLPFAIFIPLGVLIGKTMLERVSQTGFNYVIFTFALLSGFSLLLGINPIGWLIQFTL